MNQSKLKKVKMTVASVLTLLCTQPIITLVDLYFNFTQKNAFDDPQLSTRLIVVLALMAMIQFSTYVATGHVADYIHERFIKLERK